MGRLSPLHAGGKADRHVQRFRSGDDRRPVNERHQLRRSSWTPVPTPFPGTLPIRAYSLATITGYTFDDVAWAPRIAIEAAYSSGDRDADDGTLGTFNPLFPRGDYFSELALLGPSNFVNVRPAISVSPYENLTLTADANAFWRASLGDGIYSPPRSLLRGGGTSDKRFVALNMSFVAEWDIDANRSLLVGYTRSFPGAFVRSTGTDDPIDFVEIELSFSF